MRQFIGQSTAAKCLSACLLTQKRKQSFCVQNGQKQDLVRAAKKYDDDELYSARR